MKLADKSVCYIQIDFMKFSTYLNYVFIFPHVQVTSTVLLV